MPRGILGRKSKQLNTITMGTKKEVEVTHEGKTYTCTIPQFNLGGKVYTAEELTAKPKVVAELIALGSAVLVEKA